jgi:hypothetical protein
MIPLLPTLTGPWSGWVLLALKIVAVTGFMAAANAVIMYAS